MKYLKSLFIILLILTISNVYAKEELNICTPTEEYKNYSKLSDEEKSKYIEPTYCSNIIKEKDDSSNYKFSFKIKSATASDSSYNAYTDNIVTPVKNQNPLGTCWAFSAISAVETNALKNNLALYDFSESHMVYSLVSGAYEDEDGKNGRYFTDNMDGGTLAYAPSYYFNGMGQLLEEDMPYEYNMTRINSTDYVSGRQIISLKEFSFDNLNSENEACTTDFISNIKTRIIKYGSVQATMYMDQTNNFKDTSMNYYLAKDTSESIDDDYPNHGIVIVGWDDSISKDNFNGATRDGAWIIKNSWGSTWSGDGFFYISYDDEFICNGIATFGGVSNKSFDKTYKAADLVGNLYFLFDDKVYLSSKFTKQSDLDEKIKRVSFSVGSFSSYNIYLSKSNTLNDHSDWILLGSGTSSTYGIDSVDISDDIEITDDFTIITEYTIESEKSTSLFTMCDVGDDTSHLDYSRGVNFTSSDGESWSDIGLVNDIYHCEPNIWAYTDEILPEPSINLENPVVVRNKTTIDISYENLVTSNISYKVYDADNNNVTSHFVISPNYSTNKVTIESDNTVSGQFTLTAEYESVKAKIIFNLEKSIYVEDDTKMKIIDDDIKISITKGSTFTYKDLTENINNNDIEIEVYNSSGTKVTEVDGVIGTGSIIKAGITEYTIIVIGDSTGDGMINSADLLKMVKHLKGTTTLTYAQKNAADCTKDSTINSADLLKVVRFLKGTTTFGI